MTDEIEELDNKIYENLSEESYIKNQESSIDESQINIFSEFLSQIKPGKFWV
jgi:hypothetical protein